ncbi:acyltransferase family protein [Achromobacter aegrifaciens]|uniref:acyltransferase family protein n=1 Tax=Achromobacter aegrifaciens TaxID=1287736 RepID=UPI0026707C93|nr:acyltransferase family protein [Achromobacter aegrifaciens]
MDGLRAVAVLAVVVFHLNKAWLPGGFVGVDIFFVISGYLITGILARKIEIGTFSFADFYLARARRILPAAFFCIAVTLVAGTIFMLPADATSLAASAGLSSVSAANFYFWKFLDTSYFANSSETVPLLHLWSLAVEEQFYLFWPLVLLAAYRWLNPTIRIVVFGVAMVASYYIGQANLAADPGFSYYMLPARAGELIIGALAYFAANRTARLPHALSEVLAFIGAALLAFSVVFLSEANGFPGYAAVPPTLGAALVILSGSTRPTLVNRLLSARPLVAVGLVSFSLYLWHWPVMAFYRYAYGPPSLQGYIVCILLMVGMTLFSYFFVERKFRVSHSSTKLVPAIKFAATTALLTAVSFYIFTTGGASDLAKPTNYVARLNALDQDTSPANGYKFNCQMAHFESGVLNDPRCILGDQSAPVRTLLWGDSHAAHFVGFFKIIAEQQHIAIRNASLSGCPPIFKKSQNYTTIGLRQACEDFNDAIEKDLNSYDTVIVGGHWFGMDLGSGRAKPDIETTIAELSTRVRQVVVALSVPLFPTFDRQCDRKALMIPGTDCVPQRQRDIGFEVSINQFLSTLAKKYPNVVILDVTDFLCDATSCTPRFLGQSAYFDGIHLSLAGSERIGAAATTKGWLPFDLELAPSRK